MTVFVDGESLSLDAVAIRQNSRAIATSPAEAPLVLESKHPASVTVLGAVAGNGSMMTPHFARA